jgi:hypothetical protein
MSLRMSLQGFSPIGCAVGTTMFLMMGLATAVASPVDGTKIWWFEFLSAIKQSVDRSSG